VARHIAYGEPRLASDSGDDALRRVAKGFKSGGINGRANTVAESTKYNPETVWSYEAGFKTTVANQLRLNGAVFDNEYKDFQARSRVSIPTRSLAFRHPSCRAQCG